MDDFDLYEKLLETVSQISFDMREVILLEYFDKASPDEKYLIGMFEDAYKTAHMVCECIREPALTQGGTLLRKLIEETAILTILTNRKELLTKYVEHYRFRKSISFKSKDEQVELIIKKFNITKYDKPLQYLDYGWLKKSAKELTLYTEAGFDDLISWKNTFLDKFVHSSFINTDLIGKDMDMPIIRNFLDILVKLFDYLCVAFHNQTGFNFVFNNKDMFMGKFRELYNEFIYRSINPKSA